VSHDPAVAGARTRFPVLASAVERHLGWARDFAVAGDVDSAVDAIRDAHEELAVARQRHGRRTVVRPLAHDPPRRSDRERCSICLDAAANLKHSRAHGHPA
jgi:hypothetical protein